MGRRLLKAAAEMAASRIDPLIAAARSEAEAEIHALLKSAIKASLLRGCVERLEADNDGRQGPSGAARLAPTSSAGETFPSPTFPSAPARDGSGGSERLSARSAAERPPSEIPSPDQPLGCYVYAMTRTGPTPAFEDEAGRERDFRLETVQYLDVQAIIARVPLDEFRKGPGQGANDPQWLEVRLWDHDRVVTSALSAGPVIPCRFCTILRDHGDVRRLLEKNYDQIAATLAALDGKEEWGVKIRRGPPPADGANRTAQRRDPGSGKAYLSGKQRHTRECDEAVRAQQELSKACHQEIATAACEAVALPLRAHAADSQDAKLLFNGSYLLEDRRSFHAAVAAAAERYRPLGLLLETTGPWPPYNFVRLDLSADEPAEVAA
jgi:hypothetical protein